MKPLADHDEVLLGGWLDGECLYSFAARFHRTSCVADPAVTCRTLFGHAHRGSSHDSPGRVDQFVSVTAGRLGSADDILRLRTPLGLHLRFRDADSARCLAMAARSDDNLWSGLGHAQLRLRFSIGLPLMACPQCLAMDLDRANTTYWRTEHQLPATWRCRTHRCRLFCIHPVRGNRVARWILPPSDLAQASRVTSDDGSEAARAAHSLACVAYNLSMENPQMSLEPADMAALYSRGLSRRNLLDRRGHLRSSSAAGQLRLFLEGLHQDPPERYPAGGLRGAKSAILRLIEKPELFCDPELHLIAMVWLFDDWENLSSELNIGTPTQPATGPVRPDPTRERVTSLICDGVPIPQCAEITGQPISAVRQVLYDRPHLRTLRRLTKRETRRATARTQWTTVLISGLAATSHPRSLDPAIYDWLFRNDRAWLRSSIRNAVWKFSGPSNAEPLCAPADTAS